MAVGDAEADALHFEMNRPDLPKVDGKTLKFPPYQYRPFPAALYHHDDPSSPRLVENEDQAAALVSRGWATEPDGAKAAYDAYHDATVAIPAAERAYSDQRLSEKAQSEMAAYEAEAEDHVVDLPAPKRGPGRPRKDAA